MRILYLWLSEVRQGFDTGFLALEGYETIYSKTLLTRKKSRLMCLKRPHVKLVETTDELNDIITVEVDGIMVCGVYRGFKCHAGESEISNWERLLKDLEKLNFNKEVIIVGDLNIDPNKTTYLCKELLSFCDSKGLTVLDHGITRARMVAGNLQESCLDLVLNNTDKTSLEKEFNDLSDHCILKINVNRFSKVVRETRVVEFLDWRFDHPEANNFLDEL